MDRLVRLKAANMAVCESADTAKRLYVDMAALPLTSTRKYFKDDYGYWLDGDHPTIYGLMLAFEICSGASMMVKLTKAGSAEANAAKRLSGGPHLVLSSLCTVEHDSHSFAGLVMPKYDRSLDIVKEFQMPPDVVHTRLGSMVEALNFIHEQKMVHMDVKEGNIFVDQGGQWWLGDFGSAVEYGAAVTTFTPSYYPPYDATTCFTLQTGSRAEWKYDWYMLVVVALLQLGEQFNDHQRLDEDVRKGVAKYAGEDVGGLLASLLDCEEVTLSL